MSLPNDTETVETVTKVEKATPVADTIEAAPASQEQSLSKEAFDSILDTAKSTQKVESDRVLAEANEREVALLAEIQTFKDAAATRAAAKKVEEDKNLSELEKMQIKLAEVLKRDAQRDKRIIEIEKASKAAIQAADLKLYKERVLREQDVMLTELVRGSTREAIDASIVIAKSKEQEIIIKAQEGMRAKLAGAVPPSMSPVPKPQTPASNPRNRQRHARLSAAEYEKVRAEMFANIQNQLN